MSVEFPVEVAVKGPGETIDYIFDYSPFPEIANGGVPGSLSVPAVSGLTIGTPTLLTTATDGIAANKGVLVPISGGTSGVDYTVSCLATITDPVTGGVSIREIRLELSVN